MRVDMAKFHNIHKDETGVIIGNGLSLNKTPLAMLNEKYATFGSNKIYRLPFTPDYYSIVDKEMMDTCLPLPKKFTPKALFLRAEAQVKNNNPIYPIVAGGFSRNIDNFVILGGTVTYVLLQIAYYMGFTKLLLVGVDHNYPHAGTVEPGAQFVAGKDDPDHFKCSDGLPYFETGKKYNSPETERVEQYYKWADEFFKLEGRKIINLTPDSKTNAFEKDTWNNYL
jgi:hypothetical protein